MGYEVVILDCYTDEPSGYGVRPFLGSHQIHLSQALAYASIEHTYLTIDDLRFTSAVENVDRNEDTNIGVRNTTKNSHEALQVLVEAETVLVIMGCFVDYDYFTCRPPRASELASYLSQCRGRVVAYYVLGTADNPHDTYSSSSLTRTLDHVEYGNAYRHVLQPQSARSGDSLLNPDYGLLSKISGIIPPILESLTHPVIAEIETGTGCNRPTCLFCIEAKRLLQIRYRSPQDVVAEVRCLYEGGVRHFRLGRQPNFFHYQRQDPTALERLLYGIRESCPEIRMLHIDNVNPSDVVTARGREFARLIAKYCTPGNVAAMGVESFDPNVREMTRIAGSVDTVLSAIEVINEYGGERGDNGLPLLLPGINLIHGLPGHSPETHHRNLEGLQKILDKGLMTYRTYYRMLTGTSGVSLQDEQAPKGDTLQEAFRDVVDRYVIPMQARVYPAGTVMSGDWEVVRKDGRSLGRLFGTSSIKMEYDEALAAATCEPQSVLVTGSLGYRVLSGRVLSYSGRAEVDHLPRR